MHAQLVAATLALAGSAFGEALSGKRTTSTVTLFSPGPMDSTTAANTSCTFCSNHPHPKDTDRNWDADRVINDTTKHHHGFKLFAYPKDTEDERIPLHLVTHESADKDDMFALHFPMSDDPEENKNQPRWNLHDGSLQTDGSLPIKDILYFRLFDGKFPKDTEFWTGPVLRDVSTKNQNQKRFQNAKDVKLVAKEGWSLVRDGDNALEYLLKGSKPGGDFFACYDLESIAGAVESEDSSPKDFIKHLLTLIGTSHLVYSAEEHLKEGFNLSTKTPGVKKGCMPLTIKAEEFLIKTKPN